MLWPQQSLPRSPAVEVTHADISRQQAAALSSCAVQKSVRAPSLPVRAGSGIKSGESIMARSCNPSFPSANIHTSHQTPFDFPSGSVVRPQTAPQNRCIRACTSTERKYNIQPAATAATTIHLDKTTVQQRKYKLQQQQISCALEPCSNTPERGSDTAIMSQPSQQRMQFEHEPYHNTHEPDNSTAMQAQATPLVGTVLT